MHIKDKKITVLRKVSTPNGQGGFNTEWKPLAGATNLWAYYRQTTGEEFYQAQRASSKEEAVFEINWRDDLNTSMRIEYKGKKYEITRIDNFEGYKKDLKIYAYSIN